jgi:serine/threonine protein kinase
VSVRERERERERSGFVSGYVMCASSVSQHQVRGRKRERRGRGVPSVVLPKSNDFFLDHTHTYTHTHTHQETTGESEGTAEDGAASPKARALTESMLGRVTSSKGKDEGTSIVLCIVMELCPDGSLLEHLRRIGKPLSERDCIDVTKQLLLALEYIHEKGACAWRKCSLEYIHEKCACAWRKCSLEYIHEKGACSWRKCSLEYIHEKGACSWRKRNCWLLCRLVAMLVAWRMATKLN